MVIVPAFAKVNLALEVTGRAGSGLHLLDSVVVRIDWHDLVGVRLSAAATLRVEGSTADAPDDDSNLAVRAAQATADLASSERRPAVWLHKRVPARAGLGGGSADAAAALRATAALLRLPPSRADRDLPALAAALGSDVPALLAGGTQRVQGTGDVLALLPSPELHLVVAMAGESSTAETYAALTDSERRGDGRVARLAAALSGGAPLDDALLGSRLEPAAFRANPALGGAAARLRSLNKDVVWHLTGSGGALFSVAPDAAAARALAAEAEAAGFRARACRTVAG